jgi:hypothetical protein
MVLARIAIEITVDTLGAAERYMNVQTSIGTIGLF